MTQLEKDIEQKLRTMVKRRGGLCWKWVSPGQAGVPDRVVLLPGGRLIFVELKRPKDGKLSRLQVNRKLKLEKMGFPHWVIWDEEDLQAFELFELRK